MLDRWAASRQVSSETGSLATLVNSFAALLQPDPRNETRLKDWAQDARTCDLPYLHAFFRGLDLGPRP